METLDRLRESLGLVYHPKNEFPMSGWYPDNNDCYEDSVNSVNKISKIIAEILDDTEKLEYICNNYELFKNVLLEHCEYTIDRTNPVKDIYDLIPKKEYWNTHQQSQQFKHESWTWITSIAISLIMHIYH